MKKLLLTLATSVLILSASAPADEVYICKGRASKRYHLKKDCSGLKNCSTAVYKVTKKEAADLGRTLCKLED